MGFFIFPKVIFLSDDSQKCNERSLEKTKKNF